MIYLYYIQLRNKNRKKKKTKERIIKNSQKKINAK